MVKIKMVKTLFFVSFAMCLAITLYLLFSPPGNNIGKVTLVLFAVPFSAAAFAPGIILRLRTNPPKQAATTSST